MIQLSRKLGSFAPSFLPSFPRVVVVRVAEVDLRAVVVEGVRGAGVVVDAATVAVSAVAEEGKGGFQGEE